MKIKIDSLDRLFSEYIRCRAIAKVGGCERCGARKTSYKQLQCSHFIGRANKVVRWDEDNAWGLCFGCHQYLGSHPLEHVEFVKHLLGEKEFEMLQVRSQIVYKPNREAIRLYLRQKLEELNGHF